MWRRDFDFDPQMRTARRTVVARWHNDKMSAVPAAGRDILYDAVSKCWSV